MAYPTIEDYQLALQDPRTAFADAELAAGRIKPSALGIPTVLSGGFALTYAVNVRGRPVAVRCFHREARGLERRYEVISQRLKRLASRYFLEFEYQPIGVRVGRASYPIVKMAWGEGDTLGVFVEKHYRDRAKISNLIESFKKLAVFLEHQGIAHGDIQEGNVLVSDSGNCLQLIDYDGMFVPELAALGASEIGHRNYQHPRRSQSVFDRHLDRFSLISLNLALRALYERPQLWTTTQSGADVMVFTANDFADPRQSPSTIADIKKLPGLRDAVERFVAICEAPYADVPSLSDFLAGRHIPSASVHVQSGRSTREGSATEASAPAYISQHPVLNGQDYPAFLDHVGSVVELVGRIVAIIDRKTKDGQPYVFIKFGHPRTHTVKINLWSDALRKAGEVPTASWKGQWVSMKGLIQRSRRPGDDHIYMTAESPSQVRLISEDQAQYRLTSIPQASAPSPSRPTRSRNADVLSDLAQHRLNSIPQAPSPSPSRPSRSRNADVLSNLMSALPPAPAPTEVAQPVRPRSSIPRVITTPARAVPSSTPAVAKLGSARPPSKATEILQWLLALFR